MAEWFAWNTDYAIGIEKIDDQHKELFRILNELGEAMWDGKGKEEIGKTLTFLANYTVEHFTSEEEFMLAHGYPDYPEHKRVHEDFVAEVTEFIEKFNNEELPVSVTTSVLNRLGDWTRQHVRQMDKEIGAYVSRRAS